MAGTQKTELWKAVQEEEEGEAAAEVVHRVVVVKVHIEIVNLMYN